MVNVLEHTQKTEAVSIAEMEAGLQCEFKRGQAMDSFAFHIHGKEAKALCGTEAIFYGTKTVTVEGVLLSLKHQNPSWFWCVECGAAFTGLDKETFIRKGQKHKG